ncbi:hypothetical protein GCM10023212_11340 [Luteolibacter yonseiensis]
MRYWRGCKKLAAEDLGLDPAQVSDRLIQLGHKRLIPREALSKFALIESRAHALVEAASFPFLGGIARFVPNPRLADVVEKLAHLREEFQSETLDFVAGYGPMRENALLEWRKAAEQLGPGAERLITTIEQSFPPAGSITRRFAFDTRLFQVAAPDSIRLEVVEGVEQLEIAEERRRIADDASRRLQSDLDSFIRESVATLREETARLAADVLATINGSENGVHQRTLNRLASFIDSFRSLNFAGDQQLEATLERFRRELLTRSAEDYRNSGTAMADLKTGLSDLQDAALRLARGDAHDIVSRFGQQGTRRFAATG